MAVWEIRDWREVEKLATRNNRCIAPEKENYQTAMEDFNNGVVRYFGHSVPRANLRFLPDRIGYIRIVVLPIDGSTAFVDYYASRPYSSLQSTITESERHHVYRNLEEVAALMRFEGISHFYVPSRKGRRKFFDDRKLDELELFELGVPLPTYLSWLVHGNKYLDLYVYSENGRGQI